MQWRIHRARRRTFSVNDTCDVHVFYPPAADNA